MARREPARIEIGRPGRTPESAALARSLATLGVTNPATGAPFTEAMLFGICGGIGASYFFFAYETFITLYVGGRINSALQKRHSSGASRGEQDHFLEVGCDRLDLDVTVRTASTPASAEKALRTAFGTGRPIIATVDQALLPLHWVPRELAGITSHPVLVEEEHGEPLLTDLGPKPFRMTWTELTAARGRVRSARNRLLLIGPPRRPIELPRAIRAGIEETARGLLDPPTANLGLRALQTWARLLRSPDDKDGWATVFANGVHLVSALTWVDHFVEVAGRGNDRLLYADFLEEAAQALSNRALRAVSEQYRALGAEWTAFVQAALPESVPPLERLRTLADRKRHLLSEVGGPAAAELGELAAARWNILAQVAKGGLPSSLGDVRTFLDRLAHRMDALAAGEERAAKALHAALATDGGLR